MLIHGDALDVLRSLPDGCVRGVVTSPPYNLRDSPRGFRPGPPTKKDKWKAFNGYDGHDDFMPPADYVAQQRAVLAECLRVVEPAGAVYYNHKWRIRGGLLRRGCDDIVDGFPVRQIIIWSRKIGISANWGFYLPTYEVIYLIARPGFRLPVRGGGYSDVWTVLPERGNPHPAPFPVEIAARCVEGLGGGPVLDPYMGSGTTAVAAEQAGVEWIGIERSAKYIRMAEKRLGA